MQFDIAKISSYIFVQTDLEELKSMKTLAFHADWSSQRMNVGPLLLSMMTAT